MWVYVLYVLYGLLYGFCVFVVECSCVLCVLRLTDTCSGSAESGVVVCVCWLMCV